MLQMTSKRGRLLAFWMAALVLLSSVFVFAEPAQAAPTEPETRVTVFPPEGVNVRRGRNFSFRAEVSGTFTGSLQWSVEGMNSTGTHITHLETIPATTPGGITVLWGSLRVASNETAHSVTVRLTAADGVTGHVTVPITAALRDVILYSDTTNQQLDGVFVFPARRPGYGAVTPLIVRAHNYDNVSTGRLSVQLTGPDAAAFRLSRTAMQSISVDDYDTFTVAPIEGLASRSTPYRATVRMFNDQGDVDERFEVSFRVDANIAVETFTLTVVSGSGGRVAIGDSNYANSWSGNFAPGSVVRIHARANTGFAFDGWSVSPRAGNFANQGRDSTTFTMPNRNVTITAHFLDWRFGWSDSPWDPRWGDWDRWDPRWTPITGWPPVSFPAPTLPTAPMPPRPTGGPVPPPAPAPTPAPVAHTPAPPNLPVHVPVPTTPVDSVASVPTPPASALRPVEAAVNGQRLHFAEHSAGLIGNTVFVPIVDLFQHMHYAVEWDGNTVTFQRYAISLSVTAGSINFTTNGVNRRLSSPPIMLDGQMMVPAEVIESIGGIFHLDANGVLQIFVRV